MIECPTCEGEGVVEHPHLKGPYKGSHSETPDDPALVECEDCDGTGTISPDTHRMAETQNSGSVRSMGSGKSSKNHQHQGINHDR